MRFLKALVLKECQNSISSKYISLYSKAPYLLLDGKQVVSRSDARKVRLQDTTTGAALQTLEGHSGSVYSVTFPPYGNLLPTHISNHWVVEGKVNIIWMPPDYRSTFETFGINVSLGHSSGRFSFLQFEQRPKLVVQNQYIFLVPPRKVLLPSTLRKWSQSCLVRTSDVVVTIALYLSLNTVRDSQI